MKFERITYSESIEAVNPIMGNKKWFKAGADIIEIEDTDVEKAKTLAKEFVKTTLSEALAENPDYILQPDNTVIISSAKTELSIAEDSGIEREFEHFKRILIDAPTKAEAEQILLASNWKFNLELKKIINQKQ